MKKQTFPIYKTRPGTPGGYFAVVAEQGDKVKFVVMEKPGAMPDSAGTFTVDKQMFLQLVEKNPVSFAIVEA